MSEVYGDIEKLLYENVPHDFMLIWTRAPDPEIGPGPGIPSSTTLVLGECIFTTSAGLVRKAGRGVRLPSPQIAKDTPVWRVIPRVRIDDFVSALEGIGGDSVVTGNKTGDCLVTWQLSGVIQGKPFYWNINFMTPGEEWSRKGERFRKALLGLVDENDPIFQEQG